MCSSIRCRLTSRRNTCNATPTPLSTTTSMALCGATPIVFSILLPFASRNGFAAAAAAGMRHLKRSQRSAAINSITNAIGVGAFVEPVGPFFGRSHDFMYARCIITGPSYQIYHNFARRLVLRSNFVVDIYIYMYIFTCTYRYLKATGFKCSR